MEEVHKSRGNHSNKIITSRKAINIGIVMKNITVEVYPLTIKIIDGATPNNYREMQFSRANTLAEFKDQVCKKLDRNPAKTRY